MTVREEQGNLKQTVYITSDRKRFRDRSEADVHEKYLGWAQKVQQLGIKENNGAYYCETEKQFNTVLLMLMYQKVSTTGKSRNGHQWNPIAVLRQKDGIGLRQKKCSYATKAYEQRSDQKGIFQFIFVQKDLRMAGKLPCFLLNLPYKGRISVVIQEPSCHTEQIRLFLFCKKIQGFFDLL